MKEKHAFKNKPYEVIEGIITPQFTSRAPYISNRDKFVILYSGGLTQDYGVFDLVNAFEKMHRTDTELIICGEGELADFIKEKSKFLKNLIFLGVLPRNRVLELQKQANLLVNPRKNSGEFTKFSFPSKILEYMASGTPILMYRLDGIPQEYFEKVLLIDDYDSLLTAILTVIEFERKQLSNIGLEAKSFVEKHKNSTVQTEKIIKLINRI